MRTLLALLAALPLAALATVNVNTAQQSELTRVKGIDRTKAKAIIEWRAANGSIDNFTELRQVPGFTPDVIEKLKPDLAFNGTPYVGPKKPERKKPAQ
jgi:competence ComEA-like helix-hairpin-helix protein